MDESIVLRARDIAKTYSEGDLRTEVLRGASFALERGKTLAIVGASGSGKSTL
ncbi:MAG: ATP-binding cassette domain-containing protein, partial [Xanthomonadaceae bacterium]|nr:ATP-binding cassette domain-containing protein [Xanthomonadaceae bacterium]